MTSEESPNQGTAELETLALLHCVATMYYLDEANQAEIATKLAISRPAVSRLLSEARRLGVVQFVIPPLNQPTDIKFAAELASALNINHVHLANPAPTKAMGRSLAPALGTALRGAGLKPGSIMVLATGKAIYETTEYELSASPGVIVTPAVGGQDEPEAWYQANELVRIMAERIGGYPTFLYAPALPGKELHKTLIDDESTAHVLDLWQRARCAVLGIGAPPSKRNSISAAIPLSSRELLDQAVGDVCLRFFDINGEAVNFPGSDRIFGIDMPTLRKIPVRIALAIGREKARSIIGAARGGFINELVTDALTGQAVLAELNNPTVQGSNS
jgi:DNA-binding transcriptional regulator LsrR (DeoR family)